MITTDWGLTDNQIIMQTSAKYRLPVWAQKTFKRPLKLIEEVEGWTEVRGRRDFDVMTDCQSLG